MKNLGTLRLSTPLLMLLVAISVVLHSYMSTAQAADGISGMIGVGTWATQAEFKDIKVTKDGRILFASDFSNGMGDWRTSRGEWKVIDGALRQTSNQTDARALIGDPSWSDYTITLKARKLGGDEGFLILFGVPDSRSKSWWNIGGWGNTQHGIESPGTSSGRVAGRIETGRWYDIKIELKGNTVRAYLDGQLIHETKRTPPQTNFGHALIPDLVADPSIVEYDGVFYCYCTTDGMGQGLSTAGLPVVWKSKDFLNWSFEGSLFTPDYDAKYWAPSTSVYKDGKYYLFPTLDNRITALVSDSPEGPFKTLDGKDITRTSGWQHFPINVGHPIDADIFLDDDGSYYMTWSQRYIAKLKPDFTGFDGEPVLIQTKRGGYSEGPCIIKRNGIYYYLYTLGGSENYQYAYMMSRDSVLGPWVAPQQDIISTTNHELGIYGPGHGYFFKPDGSDQWYFAYLEYGRSGTNRQVLTARMYFNPDGTIKPIQLTMEGVGAIGHDPDYATPNLAHGKLGKASSIRPDLWIPPIADPRLNRLEEFDPKYALDGSNGSRWMADEEDGEAWYRLDLGQQREVERTELYFVKPTVGHAYKLEYSLDGETWQSYGGHEEVSIPSPHRDAKSVTARYFRVTILHGAAGLWEFKVY